MFNNLPNLNVRIIPSLLYSTIKANLPMDGDLSSLSKLGIISESDFLFLIKASAKLSEDYESVLGKYNNTIYGDAWGWFDHSVYKIPANTDNQYAHDMCPYISTSELRDKNDLKYVFIATDWIRSTCLVQPYVVYKGEVYGYKQEPIPVLEAIKESFCKIFEVVPMEVGLKSPIFRGFARRYCD